MNVAILQFSRSWTFADVSLEIRDKPDFLTDVKEFLPCAFALNVTVFYFRTFYRQLPEKSQSNSFSRLEVNKMAVCIAWVYFFGNLENCQFRLCCMKKNSMSMISGPYSNNRSYKMIKRWVLA